MQRPIFNADLGVAQLAGQCLSRSSEWLLVKQLVEERAMTLRAPQACSSAKYCGSTQIGATYHNEMVCTGSGFASSAKRCQ